MSLWGPAPHAALQSFRSLGTELTNEVASQTQVALPSIHKELSPIPWGEALCACQAEERACRIFVTGLDPVLPLNQDWLWLKSELLRWTNVTREQDGWWCLCCPLGSPMVLCVLILRLGPVTHKTHTCKQHLCTWPSFHPSQNATSMQAGFPSEEGWLSFPARVGSYVMLYFCFKAGH